jgi:hypothetical protein
MNVILKKIMLTAYGAALVLAAVYVSVRNDQNPNVQARQPNQASTLPQEAEVPQTKGKKPDPSKNYGFSEATPEGNWIAGVDFDVQQTSDPEVPVVVTGVRSYAGKGSFGKQVMVDSVVLRNRSLKLLKSVTLGWILITDADRQAGKNLQGSLKEGHTKAIRAAIIPGKVSRIEDLKIDFVKEAKELIRSGVINDLTFLRLRVVSVEFMDGSRWKEGTAKSNRAHAKMRTPRPDPACVDTICLFFESGQGYCLAYGPGAYCKRENCNPNDPNACFCNVYSCTECHDEDEDGWTDCAGDCEDDDPEIDGREDLHCQDMIDNDCDGRIDCDDPLCISYWKCVCYKEGTSANDRDQDGYCDDVDCDDFDPLIPEVNPCQSPIVVDPAGNGFNLTNSRNGVNFDLNADGQRERLGWTAANSDDAWLALDRNGNGKIDNGTELFGNYTPQPDSSAPNGFIALAEFDKLANGGDLNNRINAHDSIFPLLRLWQDVNHDGVSQTAELKTLSELEVRAIDLDYRESRRRDRHGNSFRYRAKIYDSLGASVGRWAWDVFLVTDFR